MDSEREEEEEGLLKEEIERLSGTCFVDCGVILRVLLRQSARDSENVSEIPRQREIVSPKVLSKAHVERNALHLPWGLWRGSACLLKQSSRNSETKRDCGPKSSEDMIRPR